jgi:hypothetical protein
MRILFVGSLNVNEIPELVLVINNVKSLVKTLKKQQFDFVIRMVDSTDPTHIPIDHLVYEALDEYHKISKKWNAESLTLFNEPGESTNFKVNIPHTSYTAITSYRLEFYKELLNKADIVIGVGGEYGLPRMYMLCEFIRKPILLLPGSGGSVDFLWRDFFRKNTEITYLSNKNIQVLKQIPYLNINDPEYSAKIHELIMIIINGFKKHKVSKSPIYTNSLDKITLSDLFKILRRFSVKLWMELLSFTIAVIGLLLYFLLR